MIEFLDDHSPRSRSTPALRVTLVSGFLGFLLGIAPLIAIVPSIDQPQDAYPLAAPSGQLSSVERGRQADAARLQGQADRWLSEACNLSDPPAGLQWRRTDGDLSGQLDTGH
ncbi:MAG TPA: hypothetical protein VFP01_04620 [Propionibacteriaceae bacterium]|nr:hypothetical protein [Propionibacteriaceae bacterium]